jgi:colanic acid biosynthesis protein WcaH
LTRFIPESEFTNAVDNLPLVSIDLCIVSDGLLLLGKRNNRPAKGFLFTPGGRIRKNEALNSALTRIGKDELGLVDDSLSSHTLMGVWDHFYSDSAYSNDVSTHYVNLPYLCEIQPKMKGTFLLPRGKDQQHCSWTWLDIKTASQSKLVHKYVRAYASWILDQKII